MTRMMLVSILFLLCAAVPAQSITSLSYNIGNQKLSFTMNNVGAGTKVEVLVDGVSQILTAAPVGTNAAELTIAIPAPGGEVLLVVK